MSQDLYFTYGDTEIEYLKKKDKRMAEAIARIGIVRRRVIPDLFAALVHSIVGQQISTKAHEAIWNRITTSLEEVTPERILSLTREELRAFGISFRKADYIRAAAQRVVSGEFDIDSLKSLSDEELCSKLTELNGIGVWSAEMLMLFSLQRPNVLSYGDLGIRRGLMILYRHRAIDRKLFEKYRKRFSPYCSVASLYLWEIASGE